VLFNFSDMLFIFIYLLFEQEERCYGSACNVCFCVSFATKRCRETTNSPAEAMTRGKKGKREKGNVSYIDILCAPSNRITRSKGEERLEFKE